jgi:hypothetical protein
LEHRQHHRHHHHNVQQLQLHGLTGVQGQGHLPQAQLPLHLPPHVGRKLHPHALEEENEHVLGDQEEGLDHGDGVQVAAQNRVWASLMAACTPMCRWATPR